MSGGLLGLLDDVAALAKLAAASIDDVGAAAGRASVKAAGVVVDDTAVTPAYVHGLAADRELPIIKRISWKSVIPAHTESTFHRHDRYRTVIGIVGGDLTTIDPPGKKTVTHYETGKAYWQEPMPPGATHKDVNETGKTIELVVIELK